MKFFSTDMTDSKDWARVGLLPLLIALVSLLGGCGGGDEAAKVTSTTTITTPSTTTTTPSTTTTTPSTTTTTPSTTTTTPSTTTTTPSTTTTTPSTTTTTPSTTTTTPSTTTTTPSTTTTTPSTTTTTPSTTTTTPSTTTTTPSTTTTTPSTTTTTATGMVRFSGNKIYNASGTRIVARGPEMTFPGSGISDLDEMAAMGANAIRVLITVDAINGATPASIGEFFARVRHHKMVAWVSFYTWNTGANYVIGSSLGGGNFFNQTAPAGYGTCSHDSHGPCYLALWDRQWMKDLMNTYKDVVIIDAMQEYIAPSGVDAGSDAGRLAWRDASISSIRFFRSRGYTQPLAIMSSFQGRDLYAIVQHGATIAAADTVKVNNQSQVIFGWQAYWSSASAPSFYPDWMGSLILGPGRSLTATQAINTILPNLPFPVQCGFDAYSGDTNGDFPQQITAAAAQKVSWLWWDWRGDKKPDMQNWPQFRPAVVDAPNGWGGARALNGS